MEFVGVKFAPLSIPFARRFQTAVVLWWVSAFLAFGCMGFVVAVYLLFTPFYWVTLLYAIWYWYDRMQSHRGGRRFSFVRKAFVWKYLKDYFPVTLHKSAELDPRKNYVCGYHPHGVICAGAFTSFGTEGVGFSEIFPEITPSVLTLNVQFMFPFYREFIMSFGVCSVSRASVEWLLGCSGTGNMIVIVIGGAKEALDAHPGLVRLTLLKRKGFVRLALKHGASLLPIFAFGENELYEQLPNPEGSKLRQFQNFVTKLIGISPPIFHGRGVFQYSFGYLPFRHPVSVVVGKPIDVEKIAEPTKEEIDRYHGLYVKGLKDLFDEHKVNYNYYRDTSLEIV